MNPEQIFSEVRAVLVELFEINADAVTPAAKLYEDLDLDSIDAVDLVIRLQQLTGKKIKPEEFKSVRTVQDIVDSVQHLIQSP
jgi:acyl carrier protein